MVCGIAPGTGTNEPAAVGVAGAEIVAPITIGTNVQLVAEIRVRTYGA